MTCDVLNRDVACPLSDGARVETSIAVPGGRHFYWFGVTSPGTQLHVETSGAACACGLYLFSDDVDSGNTPIASGTNALDLGISQPGPYLLEVVPDQNGGLSDERYGLGFGLTAPIAEEAIATEPAMQTAPAEPPATVAVPPVVAHSSSDAGNRIRAAGLAPQFQTAHLYSPGGAGTVAAQDPPAGSVLQVGSPVTLLVASGNVAVPAVVGLAEQDALTALKQSGFDVVARRARRSNVGSGQASSTDPPAGAIVPDGTTVTLTISQGP